MPSICICSRSPRGSVVRGIRARGVGGEGHFGDFQRSLEGGGAGFWIGRKKGFVGRGGSFRKPRKAECSFAYKMTGDLDRRRQGVLGR